MSGSSLSADRTRKQPIKKLFPFLLLWLCAAAPAALGAESSPDILVADFSTGPLRGRLGNGSMGIWKLDPSDPDTSCEISLQQDSREGALAIDYRLSAREAERAKAGVWLTLGNLDLRHYNEIQIEMKGDPKRGYPQALRVELKEPNLRAPEEMMLGSWNITDIGQRWTRYTVPLDRVNGLTTWRDVRELVLTFDERLGASRAGRILIRRIVARKVGPARPWAGENFKREREKPTDRLSGMERALEQARRLRGFPRATVVRKEFPGRDREFLLEVAKDTWKYFDNAVDVETGLPIDNIGLSSNTAMGSATIVGDYTNITNIGLYFACITAAEDFGLIDREGALDRALKALRSLGKMETHRGMFYNYYDTSTLEKTTHFLSSIDNAWLFAGLIVLRNAYPGKVTSLANHFIRRMDLSFFYDPVERALFHGYYTNIRAYSEYHYGVFYTEARAASYLGIAQGGIPAEHWTALSRTFPKSWGWQRQVPQEGTYVWDGKSVIPSWGGPMFEALMPSLLIDEQKFSPRALGLNNLRHAQAQVDYAKLRGYPVWGMSSSSDGEGGYREFGVASLGLKGYQDGVVTPHATFLALPYVPGEAVANLREYLRHYPIYGEYGFYDACVVKTGKVAYRYLALDQAMSFLGLANFLNPGKMHQRFHSDPIVQKGESLLMTEPALPN